MFKFRQYIKEAKIQVWNVPVKYDSPSGSGTKVHKVRAFHAHNAKNVAAVNHKQDHPDHKNVTFGEPQLHEDDFSPVLGPGDPQGNEPATNRAKKQDLGMDEEETPFALRLKKIKDAIPNSRPQDAPASLGTPSDRSPVQVPKIVKGS